MALRGAVATACSVGGRHRNPSLLSIPHYLKLKYHYPPSHALHRFTAFPIYQPGGLKYLIRAISEATLDPLTPKKEDEEQSPQNWTIKMLYDGDCLLCMREVNMLRERNKDYGTIKFVDISSDEYSPEENQGLDYKTVMGRIHAILSYGTVVTDVEAHGQCFSLSQVPSLSPLQFNSKSQWSGTHLEFFRHLEDYMNKLVFGWVYAITKYEPIATITDAVYGVWAKYHLQITGRLPLEDILELRKNKDEVCNDRNSCKK